MFGQKGIKIPIPSCLAADKLYGQKAKTTPSRKKCKPIILSAMSLTDEVNGATSSLSEEICTLKQWIAEENEDPVGPFSKDKKVDEMNVPELEQECLFLRSRLRSIYTHKLQVNSRWEEGMDSLPLHKLRSKASGLLSGGFTIGNSSFSKEVMDNRQTQ